MTNNNGTYLLNIEKLSATKLFETSEITPGTSFGFLKEKKLIAGFITPTNLVIYSLKTKNRIKRAKLITSYNSARVRKIRPLPPKYFVAITSFEIFLINEQKLEITGLRQERVVRVEDSTQEDSDLAVEAIEPNILENFKIILDVNIFEGRALLDCVPFTPNNHSKSKSEISFAFLAIVQDRRIFLTKLRSMSDKKIILLHKLRFSVQMA